MEKTYLTNKKLACITLDYEKDYGDRIGEFNIIDQSVELNGLKDLFNKLDIPVSLFVTTNLLEDFSDSFNLATSLGNDFHSHSHTHNTNNPDTQYEIKQSKLVFEKYFKSSPIGYRAPQGVLYPGDRDLLIKAGYNFSSSVFPSFRPGKYSNLSSSINPTIYENGFVEMPFAVVKKIRYTFSLSYLKLLGIQLNKLLISSFGLPNIVVFDSHLHDYITNEESLKQLPPNIRRAYSIRKDLGMQYMEEAVLLLKKQGYEFKTESDTEVILSAYHYWGTECLDKFNGMWAFAIYDPRDHSIFISRDRFGIKPVYFTQSNDKFAIVSEIKQLTKLKGWAANLNDQIAFDFLTRGQLLSFPMIIFGIVLIYLSLKNNNEAVS